MTLHEKTSQKDVVLPEAQRRRRLGVGKKVAQCDLPA